MTTTHSLPSASEIIALLKQNGQSPADKSAFIDLFKSHYPGLSAAERSKLIAEILAYVDSVLDSEAFPVAA